MKKLKPYIISIILALSVGALSGFATKNSMDLYQVINRPMLSPPSSVFPIVWTVLYILMGISAAMIYTSKDKNKDKALKFYIIQLILNFFWSIIFFNLEAYLIAFLWLVILAIVIIIMIKEFAKINKTAAYLQIPYLIWVIFAGYLNFSIWMLNK